MGRRIINTRRKWPKYYKPLQPLPSFKEIESLIQNTQLDSMYKTGNYYVLDHKLFILAIVEGGRKKNAKCCLVSLDDGNRWQDAIEVFDHTRITTDEWIQITGNDHFEETVKPTYL